MTTNARPPVDRLIEWPGDSTETAQSASISPDGRLVSYVALGPGDLHVREVESGRDVAVTRFEANGGFVDYSAISHDGKFIAVIAAEKGKQRQGLHIVSIGAPESAEPRLLLPGQLLIMAERAV